MLQRTWVNKVLYTKRLTLTIADTELREKNTMDIGDSFKVCWAQRLKVQPLR